MFSFEILPLFLSYHTNVCFYQCVRASLPHILSTFSVSPSFYLSHSGGYVMVFVVISHSLYLILYIWLCAYHRLFYLHCFQIVTLERHYYFKFSKRLMCSNRLPHLSAVLQERSLWSCCLTRHNILFSPYVWFLQ